jgi:hypothetical protein
MDLRLTLRRQIFPMFPNFKGTPSQSRHYSFPLKDFKYGLDWSKRLQIVSILRKANLKDGPVYVNLSAQLLSNDRWFSGIKFSLV